MKKRVLAVMLVMVMAASMIVGCAKEKSGGEEDKDKEAGGKKKIAVLISDMTATYASWLAQSFEELGKEYPDYEVTVIDNKNNVATQISNLENSVAKKYDMIVIQSIDNTALIDPINATIEAGVPVCTVNATNEGSEDASCVDCDPVQQGSVPAKVALDKIPQNGKVVVLLGPSGNVHSIGRREGFEKTLFEARPDIEILDEQIANWYKDEGMALMEDWLQKYDKIDAVVSMNDAMALGAIEAAKAAGRLEGMTSYGVDGLADACLSVEAGELTATCVQNAYEQAKASLGICDKVLKGGKDAEIILVEGELIDSSNVADWVQTHKDNGQIK